MQAFFRTALQNYELTDATPHLRSASLWNVISNCVTNSETSGEKRRCDQKQLVHLFTLNESQQPE